jgi:hypothetical protein
VKLELNPDWTGFLSLLISKRVRFVLVGGHTVAVDPTLANAARLREALLAFGFGSDVPSVQELKQLPPGTLGSGLAGDASAFPSLYEGRPQDGVRITRPPTML